MVPTATLPILAVMETGLTLVLQGTSKRATRAMNTLYSVSLV